jgi:uncharacterized protein
VNPIALLERHYPPGTLAHRVLLRHSRAVAALALATARRLRAQGEAVDEEFVEQAALLHDVGILHTDAPELGCHGSLPYLAHGIKGREMLDAAGWPRHALVCERHIGIGLSAAEILAQRLPLPARDMLPLSLEEQIVTYADLFFSKTPAEADRLRSADQVRASLARFGAEKVPVFDAWHRRFAGAP